MSRLRDILLNKAFCITKIAFGHCDYNLDCNYFPFYHQDTEEYWDWVNKLIVACGSDITFLNSPYLNLNEDDCLFDILSRLTKLGNMTGQITLSLRQSKVCGRFNHNDYQLTSTSTLLNKVNNVIEYAQFFVNNFNQFKIVGKNFALIPNTKKLLSPQEYSKAIEIISGNDELKN